MKANHNGNSYSQYNNLPPAFTLMNPVPAEVFAGAKPLVHPVDPADVQTVEWTTTIDGADWSIQVMFYPIAGALGAGTPFWIGMDITCSGDKVVSFVGEIRELCEWESFHELYELFDRDVPKHLLPDADYIIKAGGDLLVRSAKKAEIAIVNSKIIADVTSEFLRSPPVLSNICGDVCYTAGAAAIRICNFAIYIRYNDREERFVKDEFRKTFPDSCKQLQEIGITI